MRIQRTIAVRLFHALFTNSRVSFLDFTLGSKYSWDTIKRVIRTACLTKIDGRRAVYLKRRHRPSSGPHDRRKATLYVLPLGWDTVVFSCLECLVKFSRT